MKYTFDPALISDLHKDARDHRPGEYFMTLWNKGSDDSKQYLWDNLLAELDAKIKQEEEDTIKAIDNFEKEIISMYEMGANDRNQAIRWIVSSKDLDFDDVGFICFKLGLPYEYESTFNEAKKNETV